MKEPQDSHMLHALAEEWGKRGEEGGSAMVTRGSQKGLQPPEPNTRATSPAPEGSHTTTQVDAQNTRHYGGNAKKQRERVVTYRQRKELKCKRV